MQKLKEVGSKKQAQEKKKEEQVIVSDDTSFLSPALTDPRDKEQEEASELGTERVKMTRREGITIRVNF